MLLIHSYMILDACWVTWKWHNKIYPLRGGQKKGFEEWPTMTHYIKVKLASQQTPGRAKHKWGTDTIYNNPIGSMYAIYGNIYH